MLARTGSLFPGLAREYGWFAVKSTDKKAAARQLRRFSGNERISFRVRYRKRLRTTIRVTAWDNIPG